MHNFSPPVSVPRETPHVDHGPAKLDEFKGSKFKCLNPIEKGDFRFRCRKCEPCYISRQYYWCFRSLMEMWTAQRTWWLTLTLRPGAEYSSYSAVQKYLKTLRKEFRGTQRGNFRYLFAEEGDNHDTRHHFHAFIHSTADLTRRNVEDSWTLGNSKCILLTDCRTGKHSAHPSKIDWNSDSVKRSLYVAKYASKAGRVRASTRYGEGTKLDKVGIINTDLDTPF